MEESRSPTGEIHAPVPQGKIAHITRYHSRTILEYACMANPENYNDIRCVFSDLDGYVSCRRARRTCACFVPEIGQSLREYLM